MEHLEQEADTCILDENLYLHMRQVEPIRWGKPIQINSHNWFFTFSSKENSHQIILSYGFLRTCPRLQKMRLQHLSMGLHPSKQRSYQIERELRGLFWQTSLTFHSPFHLQDILRCCKQHLWCHVFVHFHLEKDCWRCTRPFEARQTGAQMWSRVG